MTQLVPMIAPALFDLQSEGRYKIIDFTEPAPGSLPGWQQITLQRLHPEVGPGSSIVIVTVLPNGVTQVLDPYMTACGIYNCFAAVLQYLKDENPRDNLGLTIDFPQSP